MCQIEYKFTCNNLSSDDFIYVDGGAYDGDSYLDCIKYQNISEAFLFEPDPHKVPLCREVIHVPCKELFLQVIHVDKKHVQEHYCTQWDHIYFCKPLF